jgi:signal transduction histidine kinase
MPQAAYKAAALAARPAKATQTVRRDAAFEAQKASFLRMVSHELRTPLNSILGFSEILTKELYGPMGAPQYKEYAQIIRSSGGRLLKLVNQVLEIARLENGADIALSAEALDTAIDDVLGALTEEMAERDVSLSVDPACEALLVMADPRGLRNVLSNLLHNAVSFSPDGGEVRLSAVRRGAEVEIAIADDGEGVDPGDLPRLLKPFEQGENALTRHGEGAGLGLAIVDLTCEAMGGKLKLLSTPGKGLTATVRLQAA